MSIVTTLSELNKNDVAIVAGLTIYKFNDTEAFMLHEGHPIKRFTIAGSGIEEFQATIIDDVQLSKAVEKTDSKNDWFALLSKEIIEKDIKARNQA